MLRTFVLPFLLLAFLASAYAAPSCTLSTTSPSVTICSPANNATVSSPVEINAGSTDSSSTVTLLQIYVDGTKKYEVGADNLDTSLAMTDGAHRVTVQAKDAAGTVFKSTINITVSGTGGTPACTLNTASPSVTICSPVNGWSGPSPVQVKAGTTDNSSPVKLMQIYIDGVKKYQVSASALDTPLDLPSGGHRLTVQATDTANTVFKSTSLITVTGSTPPPTQSPIQHLIVIQLQNHSFDNLFGTFPGANGIDPSESSYSQTDANGNVVTPHLLPSTGSGDLPHSRQNYVNAWDNGKMDKYAFYNGDISMGYYDNTISGIDKLWGWAQQYALADNYFAPVLGSAPADELYMVAAADNNFVFSVQPFYGPCQKPESASKPYTFPNVGDQMSAQNLSWTWFAENYGACGGGYLPVQDPFQFFTSTQNTSHIQDLTNFYAALDGGSLPALSYVQPNPTHSMHPSSISISTPAKWLDGLLTRIQNSPQWNSSAVVILWDESGGWWDHVPPPQVDSQGLGARVPMLVISPYAKRGYISHVQMDHVSVLRFIQWNWSLGSLNTRNTQSNNLLDMFQF